MKIFKRVVSLVTAVGLCGTFAGYMGTGEKVTEAATVVSLSPNNKYDINNGVFEGWGTSLCWWANRVGYSDELASKTAELFFGDSGLRMNIARFNIGGGDDPSHNHITRTDSNMPGYSKLVNGKVVYDWNADYNQRNVLKKSIAANKDLIVEMFSNSPPFYMTQSGCTSGNKNAGQNNLKNEWYAGFADYMAEVSAHYEKDWGIHVQSIEPFNEPYTNFWGAYSPKQEGCHFDIGDSESKMIMEMKRAMAAKGLNNTMLVASDETSIDTQIDAFNKLSGDAKNAISRIDTHTYGGWKRTDLKNLAIKNGKNLWMSEVDGGATAGTNAGEMGGALWLANRIRDDCNGLNCSAWILWQAIDKHISKDGYMGKKDSGMPDIKTGFWGLAVADHDKKSVILTQKYYAFGQFSRYIRPGYTMLKTSDSTVAAYDPKGNRLVIVAVNDGSNAKQLTFNLSEFGSLGDSVQVIRTSGSVNGGESWKDVGKIPVNGTGFTADLKAQSVTTYILDNVKAVAFEGTKIDIPASQVTGSNPWKDSADTAQKVFDGNTSTFFDGVGNGWVQADLGGTYDISAVGYSPRSGYEYRAYNGVFWSSADGNTWQKMYTIDSKPSFGMHYITKLENTKGVRYIKYQVPEGAPSDPNINKDNVYCCNIAEIEVYGEKAAPVVTEPPVTEPPVTEPPVTEPPVTTTVTEPPVTTEAPAPEKVAGDINSDGVINSFDITSMMNYLIGLEPEISSETADMNKDGSVSILDLILLKSVVSK